MFKLKLKTDTALGLFRSILLIVLTIAVTISAAIAVVGVLTNVFGDTLWRVVATSGIIAGLSFAILLASFSLPRQRLIDRLNTALGIPAATITAVFAFNGLYEWHWAENLFSDTRLGQLTSTFVTLMLACAGFGLLLNISKSVRSVRAAIVTSSIMWALSIFMILNTWVPSLFSRRVENQWGGYDELLPFWEKTFTILGILLAASAVVTFVLELVGIAHARQNALREKLGVGIEVVLPDDIQALVKAIAHERGITEAELIADFVRADVQPKQSTAIPN